MVKLNHWRWHQLCQDGTRLITKCMVKIVAPEIGTTESQTNFISFCFLRECAQVTWFLWASVLSANEGEWLNNPKDISRCWPGECAAWGGAGFQAEVYDVRDGQSPLQTVWEQVPRSRSRKASLLGWLALEHFLECLRRLYCHWEPNGKSI